jgi:hypothetical protein
MWLNVWRVARRLAIAKNMTVDLLFNIGQAIHFAISNIVQAFNLHFPIFLLPKPNTLSHMDFSKETNEREGSFVQQHVPL